MKNIAVLTVLFIIIFTLSAINPVYSQNNEQNGKYTFSLGTGFGAVYGQALELVYPVPGETKGELLSELIWDMKPVFYAGVYADFGLTDIMSKIGFFSSLSFKAGIPGESGIMEDRDWMSTQNNALTHYSCHTNRTLNFFWLDLALGGTFPVKSFYIKPFISGSWMQFAFTGSGGFYKYANYISHGIYEPIEDSSEKPLSGDLISYRQDWLILAAGLSVGSNILYPFLFEFSFQITPLNYCAAVDNHLYDDKNYYDYTRFGLFIEPRGNISLTTEKVKFSLEAAYRNISPAKGDSYINNTYLSPNKAGAGLSIMDYQFIVKYIF